MRFWILTTSYVDMYGSVIGPCLNKIFFIFPILFDKIDFNLDKIDFNLDKIDVAVETSRSQP